MKKFITAALACVLTLGMSVTAFAAGSVTGSQTTAVDSKGNQVSVTVTALSTTEKTEANTEAQNKYGVAPLWSNDITVVGASASNPITIQIPVPGIKTGDTVVVLHKRSTDNVWETLNGTAGNGTVSVTVTSCSPFAVVRTATATAPSYSPEYYENLKAEAAAREAAAAAAAAEAAGTTVATAETTATTSATSPKTADNGVLGFAVIAVLCGAAYVLVPRKKMA